MKISRIVVLSMPLLFAAGRGEGDAAYSKRVAAYREPMNALRQSSSIPIIPSGWVLRMDSRAPAWDNPEFLAGKKVPMHQYKFLTFANYGNSGSVLAETDHYGTGRSWVDPDAGTMEEYVRITYSFDLQRQGKPPWEAEVLSSGYSPKHITLIEAERILEGWGVQRLKFNTQGHDIAQPDGAANGSQPLRPETNRTPSAAGSRR